MQGFAEMKKQAQVFEIHLVFDVQLASLRCHLVFEVDLGARYHSLLLNMKQFVANISFYAIHPKPYHALKLN